MVNGKKKISFLSIDCFWSLALTLFFTINMNYDWSKMSVVWYGSILLVLGSYVFVYNGLFPMMFPSFSKWMLSFTMLGVVSLIWSISAATGFTVIKNLIVLLIILLVIQFSIHYGYSINTLLKCYFVATLINMMYIFVTIDLDMLGEEQLGIYLLEGWNGNGIGFMMVQGALIGVYLMGQYKDVFNKVLLLAGILGFTYLTICTGSRTAFIMLIAGLVIYFWITHPTKIVRNVIITAVILYVAFYLAMNVDSFYNVLGSRLEGLFALFSGKGEVDGSTNIRNVFIENGKKWFAEQPILGYGINNYKELNKLTVGRFTYAHNTFIEIAVDLGVVGLVWYYSAYVYLGVRLIKSIKISKLNAFMFSALAASLISQYGSVSYYGFYQNFLLMLCFYAVNKSKEERIGSLK